MHAPRSMSPRDSMRCSCPLLRVRRAGPLLRHWLTYRRSRTNRRRLPRTSSAAALPSSDPRRRTPPCKPPAWSTITLPAASPAVRGGESPSAKCRWLLSDEGRHRIPVVFGGAGQRHHLAFEPERRLQCMGGGVGEGTR